MKKIFLVVAVAVSFLVGYASVTQAWPLYGRNELRGYFTNVYDEYGDDVWSGGIPASVNSANEFIVFVRGKLAQGPGSRNGVGAAFIIQTMIGSAKNNPPSAAQVAEWESRVRYAETQGWINWNQTVNYTTSSIYQGTGAGPNPNDDAFYDHANIRSDPGIVFRNAAGVVYQLRRECANPFGTTAPLTDAPSYTVGAISSVSDTTVVPGQTVAFSHRLGNAGPNNAPNVRWTVRQNGAVLATGGPLTLGTTGSTVVNTNNLTIPNNAAPGTAYCQLIQYTPLNQNGGSGSSVQVCATVVADYELTPTVTVSATSAQQNSSVSFTYRVFNSGPTPSTNTTCKVVGNNHAAGYTPLGQQDVDRTSDVGYTAPTTTCPRNFLVAATAEVATETVNVGTAAPGSKICRSLVIDPRNEGGGPRSSAETCVTIAKTPYVNFMGNDVWAGGGFPDVTPACNASSKITTTANTLQDGSIAGSMTEYAAFALGRITNFGSASKAIVNPAAATGKMLTFSNIVSTDLGSYGAPQHCINSYVASYTGVAVTTQPATIDVNRASGTWHVTGAHSFNGNVPNGSQQIYLVEGDVTINGNIRYSDSYGSIGDMPSLVIIATGNIDIQDNVQQMDGLYVAKQSFNTCSNAPAGNLSVSTCNNQLVVNGAVIVGQLNLLRTYGADGNNDADRKRPAEVFNFSPEMYLRSALNNSNSTLLKVMDERDLPPRY